MDGMRKTVRKYYLKQVVACWVISCMLFALPLQTVKATPSGGTFTVGTGSINPVSGGDTTVVVDQVQSVIEWGSPGSGGIDTSGTESLSFMENGGVTSAAVLNRIMSGNPTQFDGALNGEGMRIFIVNQAGIVFGAGSSVNVTQLVASTLGMTNADFLAGNMIFQGGSHDGRSAVLENNGAINATGSAYLIGGDVRNYGTIYCPEGEVVMVAANDEKVIITGSGSNIIVELEAPVSPEKPTSPTVTTQSVEPPSIVLGYGDIYSTAIAGVYTKTAKATAARDVKIEGTIEAEAIGNGIDNAVATIAVEAGGNVEITADGRDAGLYAEAYDGQNNTSTITVDAGGNIEVKAENSEPDTDYEAYIWAETYYGTTNISNVDVEADGYVNVQANASSNTWGAASIGTEAYDGQNNTANVTVDALGDVDVIANHGAARIEAYADSDECDVQNNTAKIEVIADGDVTVKADSTTGITSYANIYSEAEDGINNNTAETVIDAGGDVQAMATASNAEAGIQAEVYAEGGTNKANTTIGAGGKVVAKAENGGETDIDSEAWYGASNTATTTITAGDYVKVKAVSADSDAAIEAEAWDGPKNTAIM